MEWWLLVTLSSICPSSCQFLWFLKLTWTWSRNKPKHNKNSHFSSDIKIYLIVSYHISCEIVLIHYFFIVSHLLVSYHIIFFFMLYIALLLVVSDRIVLYLIVLCHIIFNCSIHIYTILYYFILNHIKFHCTIP